mgnify:CR=1 FL=1
MTEVQYIPTFTNCGKLLNLGDGYNCLSNEPGVCLFKEFEETENPINRVDFKYALVEDAADMRDFMNVSSSISLNVSKKSDQI